LNNKNILTVGVPTFNRKSSVCSRLQELLLFKCFCEFNILIIDNCSDDGTYEDLKLIISNSNHHNRVKILKNTENIGYANNLIKLFDFCETSFLVVDSDEDSIQESGLIKLNDFINTKQNNTINFISPKVIIDGHVYRGKNEKSLIDFKNHRDASNYISGICFNVHASRLVLPSITNLIYINSAALIYPQVLLAAYLCIQGNCFWLDSVIAIKKDQLFSHISHSATEKYYYLPSRWRQFTDFIKFYDILHDLPQTTGEQKKIITIYKKNCEKSIYIVIKNAIAQESPHFLRLFNSQSRFFLIPGIHQALSLKRFIFILIINPSTAYAISSVRLKIE
jgi:glycosyltransferase involved in cell wall biosynthesis